MLSHQQSHLGQVMYLSAFLEASYHLTQRLLSFEADQWPIAHHLIRTG